MSRMVTANPRSTGPHHRKRAGAVVYGVRAIRAPPPTTHPPCQTVPNVKEYSGQPTQGPLGNSSALSLSLFCILTSTEYTWDVPHGPLEAGWQGGLVGNDVTTSAMGEGLGSPFFWGEAKKQLVNGQKLGWQTLPPPSTPITRWRLRPKKGGPQHVNPMITTKGERGCGRGPFAANPPPPLAGWLRKTVSGNLM